jgi:hypothetical protein
MNSKGFQTARNFSNSKLSDTNYKSRQIYNNPEKDLQNNINKFKSSMLIDKNTTLPINIKLSENLETKEFLKSIVAVKKSNNELSNKVFNQIENTIKDDKLVTQLEIELDYYKQLNLKIQGDLLMTSTRKTTSHISESAAQNYCKELKKKFKEVVEKIEAYEKLLKELDEEKESVIVNGDFKLESLSDEKAKLIEDQETLNVKINYQKELVIDLDMKLASLIQERQNQKIHFDSKNNDDESKHHMLQLKYYDLSEKMKEYSNEEAMQEYEELLTRRAINDIDKEKEDLNM